MEKNNFEQLQDNMEEKFTSSNEAIKKNVRDRKDVWTMIGDLFDLFIPKIATTFFGTNDKTYNNGINQDQNVNED